MEVIKATSLWKNSIGNPENEKNHAKEIARLSTALDRFRANVTSLAATIIHDLPQLTVHDVTHLDALWEVADLIAGPNYPLTPAEAFVLGGAILLHDSALCFEAYEGGKAGLRATVQWTDAYATAKKRNPSAGDNAWNDEADFSALRTLHAKRAADLGAASWMSPEGSALFLIEDPELRESYGPLIGEIAASHHWDLERVRTRFDRQFNAIPSLPTPWRVDPLKVACLLRCADAAHIDSRRAPDFLRALIKREGISAEHWKAQNWLARADIDQSDSTGSTLIITSRKKFRKVDFEAWWVAFDALSLIQREIEGSNNLLTTFAQTPHRVPFRISAVAGASSPAEAQKHIEVSGWSPCAAEIGVSNVEGLVQKLGGEALYGADSGLRVMLRELIQNARDAIVARRKLDDPGFSGAITISVFRDGDGKTRIQIDDDGVGMSERVLTGPLLDFGTSFWTTNLVHTEFPGLAGSGFDAVGRFGIGFYSVFMAADQLSIMTRSYTDGLNNVCSLHFPKGLTLRPLLERGAVAEFSTKTSTRLSLTFQHKYSQIDSIKLPSGISGIDDYTIDLKKLIQLIVVGVNVDIFYKYFDAPTELIHKNCQNIDTKQDVMAFLQRGALYHPQHSTSAQALFSDVSERMRKVEHHGHIYGYAALSHQVYTTGVSCSHQTIGGFSTSISHAHRSQYIGFFEYSNSTANRNSDGNMNVPDIILKNWCTDQIDLLKSCNFGHWEWCHITSNLAELKNLRTDVAHFAFWVGQSLHLVDLENALQLIESNGIAIYESDHQYVETHHRQRGYQNYPTFYPVSNGALCQLKRDEDGNSDPNSFIGVLERLAEGRGRRIVYDRLVDRLESNFGTMGVTIARLS